MKKAIVIFLALGLALTGAAQGDYVEDWNPDADGDGNVGVTDLLALLSVFSENDVDGDGIWDSVDDCIGVYDPCGVCNGTGEDADEDGLCDDVDDCVGAYDECGVCNGPGPEIPVIDEILYETDSVYIEVLGEWYVFEYATDTLLTYVCPVYGCTDFEALNYDPNAFFDDGNCVFDWYQLGQELVGEFPQDLFGYSVSISGDGSHIVVGAPFNDGNGDKSGDTRVFHLIDSVWTQMGSSIIGESEGDRSGESVSISDDGTRIAIGAPENDIDGDGAVNGHARIYEWDGAEWLQLGSDIDGEEADVSGRCVALSGDGGVIAVGADGSDNNGQNSGAVRVFQYSEGDWIQVGDDINGEHPGENSGDGLSISDDGSVIAIGAANNDDNGDNSGQTRVFELIEDAWVQRGSDINGEAIQDLSGKFVSLSGDGETLAIGATLHDENGSNSGQIRIFEWNGDDWAQMGDDIFGDGETSYLGKVSLSDDGMFLATGATGQNWNDVSGAGVVKVYHWNGSDWEQLGESIFGTEINEWSGVVSISDDGMIVAIGAGYGDGGGFNNGEVKMWSRSTQEVLSD